MRVERLDHLVLTVADIDASCAFYQRVLGMQVVTFGQGRKALAIGNGPVRIVGPFGQVDIQVDGARIVRRPGQRHLRLRHHHRLQRRVEAGRAVQVLLQQLGGRDLTAPQSAHQLTGGQQAQVLHLSDSRQKSQVE